MKRLWGFIAVLAVLLSGITSAAQDVAPDTQSGSFLFKMPPGWKPEDKGNGMAIFAPPILPGSITFIALAADDMAGDLQNSFQRIWGGFANSYQIVQGGQTQPFQSPTGYNALYTTAVLIDQKGAKWQAYVMGAQYKKRLQTVVFMSNLSGSNVNAPFDVFQKTFLASLSFGEALPGSPHPSPGDSIPVPDVRPVAEPPHKLPPGALEGIYMSFSLDTNNGRVGLKRLNFNPDGWAVKDVPQEGMIGFDFTAYRNAPTTNRSWVGRYRLDGNQINILWQDYADNRQVIKRNEAAFSPGVDTYIPMCRCTGKKFSGKYNYGLASSGQSIEFFPDGTFIDHQVLDQMLVPNAFFSHPRTQRGAYSIQSQTIIFTFADGRRGMRTF